MENEIEIIKILATQGPFAILFVLLLFWVLKEKTKFVSWVLEENAKRETAYQATIDKLADRFALLEDIKEDVEEIKIELRRKDVIK